MQNQLKTCRGTKGSGAAQQLPGLQVGSWTLLLMGFGHLHCPRISLILSAHCQHMPGTVVARRKSLPSVVYILFRRAAQWGSLLPTQSLTWKQKYSQFMHIVHLGPLCMSCPCLPPHPL